MLKIKYIGETDWMSFTHNKSYELLGLIGDSLMLVDRLGDICVETAEQFEFPKYIENDLNRLIELTKYGSICDEAIEIKNKLGIELYDKYYDLENNCDEDDSLDSPHLCPVCGEYEFKSFDSMEICPVCNWQDDLNLESIPNWSRDGRMTLNEARKAYKEGKNIN